MAPTVRASASNTGANGLTSYTVTKPTGTVAGDILIAYQTVAFGSSLSTPTGGATWLDLGSEDAGFDVQYAEVWWKVAGGSEPASYTFSKISSGDSVAIVVAIQGAATSTPLVASAITGSTTACATPSLNAVGSADLDLRFGSGTRTGSTTWTPPGGFTELQDTTSGSSPTVSASAAWKALSASGATGAQNFTASGTLDSRIGVSVVVASASTSATVDAATVNAAADVPAATINAGQTASPAVVAAAGDIPAPGVQAGQTAAPAAVTGQAAVPAPNVIAGSAQLVQPDTVTAAGEAPAPTITAIENATTSPAVVGAEAQVPAPTVAASVEVVPAAVTATGVVPSPGVSVPILPGDLVALDGQVEWGGSTLWGAGTSYALLEITGWDAKPKVDSLTQEEPGRHGAYAGRSYLERRIVTVKLQVQSLADPTQVSGLLRQLRYDTRTLRDNTLWTLVVRGYTETLLAYGKCIDRTGVMDRDWSIGAPEPVITIECPDSRRYSLDQHSVVVPANAATPTALVNDGDLYTSPILRFTGPATNPMLVNETLNRVLAFNITLTSGQLLIVDTLLGKATIADVDHENDLADTISVPLKEFFAEVGSNDLSYETNAGGTAGCEILWRDASE